MSTDSDDVQAPPTVELLPPGDLIPHPRNARTHSEAQVAQVAGSIREFGFTSPVLIDDQNGILAGHCRVLAALKLGLEVVPCIRLSTLTPWQRRAYMIADNRLAELAGWDRELLALELGEMKEHGLELELTGFTDSDLEALLVDVEDGYDADAPEGDEPMDQYNTVLSLGPYRLKVERARFLAWEERMRAAVGFEKEAIVADMVRRLEL